MIYRNDKAIYVKMADAISGDILSDRYHTDDRLPSVRELAVQFEVNINTALRTMELLQRDEIVYQKRGIGYFVSQGAKRKIGNARRKEFMESTMPEFFRQMKLLGIGMDEVNQAWAQTEDH